MTRVRIVGAGRAGTSFAAAFTAVGFDVEPLLQRGDDLTRAAEGVDVVLIATPDAAIGVVAAAIDPQPNTVMIRWGCISLASCNTCSKASGVCA